MNEMSQLASAMATLIFAAGMLIAEQLYTESRSANASISPIRTARNPSRDVNPSRDAVAFRTSIKPSRSIQIPRSQQDRSP